MNFSAYDTIPYPTFIAALGGRHTYVNRAWQDKLRCECGELWTTPFDDLDLDKLGYAWNACRESTKPLRITSKAGPHPETFWYHITCQLIDFDNSGEKQILGTLDRLSTMGK